MNKFHEVSIEPVRACWNARPCSSLRQLLHEHGYSVEQMFGDHIFPWRVSDYVQYRYNQVWYFAMLPKTLVRVLDRGFGWHLCVTATV